MIPTKANTKKFLEERRAAKKKPKVHQKIENTFIENAIKKPNIHALKTIYYLSTVLDTIDMSKMQDDKIVGLKIDKREMLKFIDTTAPTLVKATKEMQETSITFYDDDGVIEGMSLLPRFRLVPNRNIIELDLYVRVAKMIIDVKRNYTLINIKEIAMLKKPHSIRMLSLLNRISSYGEDIPKRKKMTLDELNAFFGVNYKKWNMLEKSILKPVKEELDSISKLSFIYEPNFEILGRGRPSFKDVTIDVITNNPQPKLF